MTKRGPNKPISSTHSPAITVETAGGVGNLARVPVVIAGGFGNPARVPVVIERRRFLVHLGVTALAGAAVSCMDDGVAEASGPIVAGNVSRVPVGSLAQVGDVPVALGRDGAGLYSMSTICTHQGCNIADQGTISSSGLACACHGSRFTAVGAVTSGPAPSPLKHWKVDLAPDGAITVQAGTLVDATTRTAVPG